MNVFSKFALAAFFVSMTFTAHAAHALTYCTIDSAFDGTFAGEGWTELEAKTKARQSCRFGSRSNGFFCQDDSISCETSRGRYDAYYCSIDSSFDGTFSGEGQTKLEAEDNAKESCREGSRSDGFFCQASSLQCQEAR